SWELSYLSPSSQAVLQPLWPSDTRKSKFCANLSDSCALLCQSPTRSCQVIGHQARASVVGFPPHLGKIFPTKFSPTILLAHRLQYQGIRRRKRGSFRSPLDGRNAACR